MNMVLHTYSPVLYTPVQLGMLYNGYTVYDARNLAGFGWKVPSQADYSALRATVDPLGDDYSNTAGLHLKMPGLTWWNEPNEGADNSFHFNGKGSSERSEDPSASFGVLKLTASFWTTTTLYGYPLAISLSYNSPSLQIVGYVSPLNRGISVRLVKVSPSPAELLLNDGDPASPYIGNDGKVYPTVKAGSQVWLAQNLSETLYRDLSAIPQITDPDEWYNLASGAWCAYNNDPLNI
jgi:uncharacterized protein (TIGR02145 family)